MKNKKLSKFQIAWIPTNDRPYSTNGVKFKGGNFLYGGSHFTKSEANEIVSSLNSNCSVGKYLKIRVGS